MKIIKRNGSEETFNIEKIINAVRKANNSADSPFLTEEQIADIADYVEYKCNKIKRAVSVEEIQDMVEDQLMAKGAFELARRYVRYRYNRSLVRKKTLRTLPLQPFARPQGEHHRQPHSLADRVQQRGG